MPGKIARAIIFLLICLSLAACAGTGREANEDGRRPKPVPPARRIALDSLSKSLAMPPDASGMVQVRFDPPALQGRLSACERAAATGELLLIVSDRYAKDQGFVAVSLPAPEAGGAEILRFSRLAVSAFAAKSVRSQTRSACPEGPEAVDCSCYESFVRLMQGLSRQAAAEDKLLLLLDARRRLPEASPGDNPGAAVPPGIEVSYALAPKPRGDALLPLAVDQARDAQAAPLSVQPEPVRTQPAAPQKTSPEAATAKAPVKDKTPQPLPAPETAPSAAQTAPAATDGKLLVLAAREQDGQTILTVKTGPDQSRHLVFALNSPPRLAVDIPGAWEWRGAMVLPGAGNISRIRLGRHPEKLRIALDLSEKYGSKAARFTVKPLPGGFEVILAAP